MALFLCVLLGGMGYAQGGILGKKMSGWRVICWSLVISLPLVIPLAFINFDFTHLAQIASDSPRTIMLFVFLCLFNNLIGFFSFMKDWEWEG